jgi:hypothetical protein
VLGGSLAPHPKAPTAASAPRTRQPCQDRQGDRRDDREYHFDRVQCFMVENYSTPGGKGESILEGCKSFLQPEIGARMVIAARCESPRKKAALCHRGHHDWSAQFGTTPGRAL